LTLRDYLLRNFVLYRLESAYEVREDICDAVRRMGPKRAGLSGVGFGGWARMALPLESVSVDEVAKPLLGEATPARVTATLTLDVGRYGPPGGEVRPSPPPRFLLAPPPTLTLSLTSLPP